MDTTRRILQFLLRALIAIGAPIQTPRPDATLQRCQTTDDGPYPYHSPVVYPVFCQRFKFYLSPKDGLNLSNQPTHFIYLQRQVIIDKLTKP